MLKNKPVCKYGKECRTQSKMAHAKKYQHWFNPNLSDDSATLDITHNNNEEESAMEEDESEDEDDDEDSMDTDEE